MPERTPLLLYHRIIPKDDPDFNPYCVSVRQFERQMRALAKRGFQTISLREYLSPSSAAGKGAAKRFILTFDDGYRDNYLHAFPVLQKYNFRPVVFLISDYIRTETGKGSSLYLSLSEIKKLQLSGWDFQSHGKTHRVMTDIPLREAERELKESKAALSKSVGPISFYTYPLGRFNEDIKKLVKSCGYSAACGGQPSFDGSIADMYEIGRTEIFESDGCFSFLFKIKTGYGAAMYLRKRIGRLKRLIFGRRNDKGAGT